MEALGHYWATPTDCPPPPSSGALWPRGADLRKQREQQLLRRLKIGGARKLREMRAEVFGSHLVDFGRDPYSSSDRGSYYERPCADMWRVRVRLRGMETRSVDPRDQTWEIHDPKYRVYFHDAKGASDEYEIGGGDVSEVMRGPRHRQADAPSSCTPACLTTGSDYFGWRAATRTRANLDIS